MLPKRGFLRPHRQSNTCRVAAAGVLQARYGTLRSAGPPLQPDSTDGTALTETRFCAPAHPRQARKPFLGALPGAPGTTDAAVAHVRSIFERLRLVHRQLADAKGKVARLIDVLGESEDSGSGQLGGQRDVTVRSSLPGVGPHTLLAEAPQALARWDYKALRCICGVAPVIRPSTPPFVGAAMPVPCVRRRPPAHDRLRRAPKQDLLQASSAWRKIMRPDLLSRRGPTVRPHPRTRATVSAATTIYGWSRGSCIHHACQPARKMSRLSALKMSRFDGCPAQGAERPERGSGPGVRWS